MVQGHDHTGQASSRRQRRRPIGLCDGLTRRGRRPALSYFSYGMSDKQKLVPAHLRLDNSSTASVLASSSVRPPRHRLGDLFLKGPIPLSWLLRVMELPGKSPLAVSLAIWFKAGIEKRRTIRITGRLLNQFHIHPDTSRRALSKLEAAHLVTVDRHAGRCPIVTLLEATDE